MARYFIRPVTRSFITRNQRPAIENVQGLDDFFIAEIAMTRHAILDGITFLKDAGWLSVVVVLCIAVFVATQMVRTSQRFKAE
jgi:hypothetical protein